MHLSILKLVHIHNKPLRVYKLILIYMLVLLLRIFQESTESRSYKIYYDFYRLS